MSDLTAVLLAVLLLAGNAFFVGAEFALISARRTQVEPRAQAGSRAARTTLRAMEHVSLMMAGAQLGITMCSLGLGALGEPAVAHLVEPVFERLGLPEGLVHPLAFVVALSVVVTLHMVLGEMVPKNLAIAGPERAALLLGPPLWYVVAVLRPVIVALNLVANAVLRLVRVEPQDEVASTFTADQVAAFVEESRREGLLDPDEHQLLTGVLGFGGETVRTAAIGLGEVVAVDEGESVAALEALCARSGFSRFPVRGPGGALVGYVHLKDLLGTPEDRLDAPLDPGLVRALVTVGLDAPLREALVAMQAAGAHMARATEPGSGRVGGVVMLEDVLERLVGEVVDAGQRTGAAS
ncbi:hemolysin family protein [Vallicoccus soli]|uniref:HlyC/CorC family transporter n=1 Tax=Vallicoccus soli TaxID=2339232 RepID=A0A3A3Z6F9_9ACTN|nr:hemolysin family protein [Vallicoccus soli]RJK96285.1 HlyC/CorC family transporter [Vallicoccus soli]